MQKFATTCLTIFLLTPCLFAQSAFNLETGDKWQISTIYSKGDNGKCVLLLHDLDRTKTDFSSFEKKLKEEGFCYLAIDLRGHGRSTNKGEQKTFDKTGQANEFNKMIFDVNTAISYLNSKGVNNDHIFLLGAGLGANIAAKSLIKNDDIGGIILLTPSLKQRDVVTLSGIKNYKNPIFIGVSSTDRKQMMEASFIRNASFLRAGQGKVTFVTSYDLKGTEMLDKYMTPEVIQWLYTPELPKVVSDSNSVYSTDTQYVEE